jgi:hypothetical protein
MTGLEITLIISTSVFGIVSILMTAFYISMKKRYDIVSEGHDDAIRNRNYWQRRFLSLEQNIEEDKERFLTQFQNNIKIGDTFYVPDTRTWKEGFRGTHQKIISIDFDEGRFNTVSVQTGMGPRGFVSWTNNFGQIKEFTWVNKQNRLKHKFI